MHTTTTLYLKSVTRKRISCPKNFSRDLQTLAVGVVSPPCCMDRAQLPPRPPGCLLSPHPRASASCGLTAQDRGYRVTSLIRNRPPPADPHRALGMVLLKGPGGGAVSYERGTPVRLGFRVSSGRGSHTLGLLHQQPPTPSTRRSSA